MTRKGYKKNKRAGEKVIYIREYTNENPNFSVFFLLFMCFLFLIIFYYLIFSYFSVKPLIAIAPGKSQQLDILQPKKENNKAFTLQIYKQPSQPQKARITQVNYNNLLNPLNVTSSPQERIIWHGPRNTKEIALTFDADMTPVMVDWLHSGQVKTYDDTRITDYLIQNQIKATFFLTGLWIESYPDATKQLADNALFELENHSYSHPSMAGYCFDQPQIPESQYPFEIEKTQQLIKQYTHQPPQYFRFPGGCYNQSDLDLIKKEGLVTVHWDDVANDGFNVNKEDIIHNVFREVQNGSIIVMHMGGQLNTPETADALPTIISTLKNKGYTFVTVSELLNPPKIATIDPKTYLTSLRTFQRTP